MGFDSVSSLPRLFSVFGFAFQLLYLLGQSLSLLAEGVLVGLELLDLGLQL